ncbi:MAG: hypothetical protein JW795_04425, partial [Chitinivibrionales bacterium]|nr:hypothetical protein [Chitinivibrionales bacterium]
MMIRTLATKEIIETAAFGGACPYWIERDGSIVVADTAAEIFSQLPQDQRIIDPVSVFELLQFNYMLGTRTLLQGVYKMPWRATLRGDGVITRHAPVPHGNLQIDPQKAARELRRRLEIELASVLSRHRSIYLLLSGGLDSRVIAGIIKKLQPHNHDSITCVTWGNSVCRDRVYARTIADWYGWNFVPVSYDEELTWFNIQRGAQWGGCETAGIHLHGLEWFRNVDARSCVIAASFGDSIGRAEFSSKHVTALKLAPLRNIADFLHPSLEKNSFQLAEADRATAWQKEPDARSFVRCELDMQENYMRRMICHAMDYLRQYCFLHQAFTSRDVVSFMWSLSPACRTDEIYHHLLKNLDQRLYTLPWARNAIAPSGDRDGSENNEHEKKLTKEYHDWSRWLRCELRQRLAHHFFAPGLVRLGVMNVPARSRLWKSYCTEQDPCYWAAQNVVKLVSLELCRASFDIQPCR